MQRMETCLKLNGNVLSSLIFTITNFTINILNRKETGEKEWIPENEVRKNIPDILEKFLEEELLKPVESA